MICVVKSERIIHATRYTVLLFPNAVYHIVAVAPKLRSRVKLTSLYDKTMKRIAEDALAMVELALLHEKALAIRKVLVEGDPAKKLIEYAEHNPIDLIVLSSAVGETPPPGIIGSTAKKIIAKTTRPVLVYTSLTRQPPEKINNILLVLNKPSHHEEQRMLDIAVTIAKRFNAKIIAYVIGGLENLESLLKKHDIEYTIVKPTREVTIDEIIEYTRRVDLVIVNKTRALEEKIPILKHRLSTICRSLTGLSESPVIVM